MDPAAGPDSATTLDPAVTPRHHAGALLALEADLERVSTDLRVIQERVSNTRRAWVTETSAGSAAAPAPAPPAPAPPAAPQWAQSSPSTQPTRPTPPTRTTRVPWWQRDGAIARVLSAVGAGVLLIGVALLLVLAITNGYFGPVPRVAVTAVVAVGLLVAGTMVHRRQPGNPGAIALAACGVAGGYLDVVAVTAVYGWVEVWTGLVLAAVVFTVGLLLSRRWVSQVLAVIVVLGVVCLAPALGAEISWVPSAFVVLVAGATLPIDRDRDWPVLQVVRVVPTAGVLVVELTGSADLNEPGPVWLGAGLCTAYALLMLAGQLGQLRRGGPGNGAVVTAMIGVSALPALVVVPESTEATLTTVWLLLLAAVWLAAAAWVRLPAARAALLSITALAVMAALLDLDRADLLVPGILVVAVGYLAVGLRERVYGWVGMAVAAVGLAMYLPIVEPLVTGPAYGWFGVDDVVSSALAVTVAFLSATLVRRHVRPGRRTGWLVGCWAVGLVSVTGLSVSVGVLLGARLGSSGTGYTAGHAAATLVWMAAASWLLARDLRYATRRHATVGVVVAGLAVAKLLVFDLSTLDGVFRVLAFIVAGAALLALGTVYARSLSAARPRTS